MQRKKKKKKGRERERDGTPTRALDPLTFSRFLSFSGVVSQGEATYQARWDAGAKLVQIHRLLCFNTARPLGPGSHRDPAHSECSSALQRHNARARAVMLRRHVRRLKTLRRRVPCIAVYGTSVYSASQLSHKRQSSQSKVAHRNNPQGRAFPSPHMYVCTPAQTSAIGALLNNPSRDRDDWP